MFCSGKDTVMRKFKKTMALGLCAATLSTAVPAFAAEPVQRTHKTGTWEPFKPSLDGGKPVISKIPKDHAYIPKDTVLSVILTSELTSKRARKGDMVPLKLAENLIVNGVVVVPAGAKVFAKVTRVTRSGMFGRAGKLEFTVDSVKAVNGVEIPLEYTAERKRHNDGGAVAVVAVVSILGGALMRGANVSFPEGSVFEAKVAADTDLNVTIDELPEAMNPEKPHGVAITIQ